MLNLKKKKKTPSKPKPLQKSLPLIVAIACIALAFSLVWFAKPISEKLVHFFNLSPQPAPTYPIGDIVSHIGPAEIRRFEHSYFRQLDDQPQKLHHKDFIKTNKGSLVRIQLKSGDIIELMELTQAFIEEWAPENTSAKLYITVLSGNYKLIQRGNPNQLYVVRERKVYTPEQGQQLLSTERSIQPNVDEKIQIETVTNDLPDTAPKPKKIKPLPPGSPMPEKIQLGGAETLTDQYIEGVMVERAPLFRRCQIIGLRDGLNISGDLLVSLTIQPSGGVRNVEILQNSLKNEQLENCVTTILEQTRFRSFKGRAFSLSYPLNFR